MKNFFLFPASLVLIIVSYVTPQNTNFVESVVCGIVGFAIMAIVTISMHRENEDDVVKLICLVFGLTSLLILLSSGLGELYVTKHFNFMPTVYVGYAVLVVGCLIAGVVKIKSLEEES